MGIQQQPGADRGTLLQSVDDYLTPAEVARLLRVHVRSVWRWILRGKIEHLKRNSGGGTHRYLIPKRAVLEKLEVPKNQPTSTPHTGQTR